MVIFANNKNKCFEMLVGGYGRRRVLCCLWNILSILCIVVVAVTLNKMLVNVYNLVCFNQQKILTTSSNKVLTRNKSEHGVQIN